MTTDHHIQLTTAWLGDSPALLVKNSNAIPLSYDHSLEEGSLDRRLTHYKTNQLFKDRTGIFRIGDGITDQGINMARSLGDKECSPTRTPSTTVQKISLNTPFTVILGSDGINNIASLASLANIGMKPNATARDIVSFAEASAISSPARQDNTSCLLMTGNISNLKSPIMLVVTDGHGECGERVAQAVMDYFKGNDSFQENLGTSLAPSPNSCCSIQ